MSRVPFAQVQGGVVSVGEPQLGSLDAAAINSGAGALEGIGRGLSAVGDVVDHMAQAREARQVSDELTKAQDTLADHRITLEQDSDTKSRAAKFQAKADEVRTAAAERLPGRALENFNIRFNTIMRPMQLQVKQQARSEEIQQFRTGLADDLDKMATASVFAKTDQERQAVQAEVSKKLEDAVRTGNVTALGAGQFKKAYLGRVDAALAGEMIRSNPSAAVAALGDTEKFKYLDAAQRVELRSRAQQRAESLGVQARAELRADAGEFIADLRTGAATGQLPDEGSYKQLMARAGGDKSAIGVRIKQAWDFAKSVETDTSGKTIPQIQARIGELQRGSVPPDETNYNQANADMKLTPQEQALYKRHLGNVAGPGGVTNPDGSRSTLYQASVERDGKTYNIPTVWGGKIVPPEEAIKLAEAQGFDQFPSYGSAAEAEARYGRMHGYMEKDRATATPRELHEARALHAALQARITARDKDPASYALQNYPTIAEQLATADKQTASQDANEQAQAADTRRLAWQALLDAQRREGVAEHRLQLLPHDAAEAMRAKFLTAEGQSRADLVDQVRGQFGDQWDRVQAQLWHGKPAPADVQVLSALPDGASLPKVEVAEAFKVTEDQAKQVLGPQRMTAIDEATRAAVSAMAPTFAQAPDGPRFLATYQTAIEKLARLYAMRGEGDDGRAAQRAADRLFFDHWETVGTVRVPKVEGLPVAEASAVRGAQQTVIDAMPKLELATPAHDKGITDTQARDMLVRSIRSNGYWMTTADDKGMVLMAGPGLPVRFADGQVLVVPFDSANTIAANRQAARNLTRREVAAIGPGGEQLPVELGHDDGPPNSGLLPRWLRPDYSALGTRAFQQSGGNMP